MIVLCWIQIFLSVRRKESTKLNRAGCHVWFHSKIYMPKKNQFTDINTPQKTMGLNDYHPPKHFIPKR